jgi:RNA polymerase sigma-70 factor (ECF subfamily)
MNVDELGRLVDSHAGALMLYARQWCTAPEDVVQEAFIKLACQSTWPDHAVGWLYRVVRRGAISAGRAESRRRKHEGQAAARREPWFVPREQDALDAERVTAALDTLPALEREVLVAHLWGGLTFEQIGRLVGTSSSSAHRRYLSGLTRMRERFQLPCPRTN